MDATDALPPFAQYLKDHKEKTIGRWLIGGIADFLLTGAFIASANDYFAHRSKRDTRGVKVFVLALLVANIVKSVQTVSLVWYRVILNFGDYIGSGSASPTLGMLDPLFTELLLVMGQAFFVVRLWQQSRPMRAVRLVLVTMTSCVLLGLCAHIILTVRIFSTNGSVLGKQTYDNIANTAMGGVVAADLLITGLASYLMIKTRVGFETADSRRSRIVAFVWSTALLPLVSELVKTVLWITIFQEDSAFVIFHYTSAKLYSLSVLFVISNRYPRDVPGDKPIALRRRADAGVRFTDPLASTMVFTGEKSQNGTQGDLKTYDGGSTTFEFAPAHGQLCSTASAVS